MKIRFIRTLLYPLSGTISSDGFPHLSEEVTGGKMHLLAFNIGREL
jgi:hypothetical protein